MSKTCKNCHFFMSLAGTFSAPDDYQYGLCKRYAPSGPAKIGEHGWPQLHRAEWCGEFRFADDAELERRHELEKTHYSPSMFGVGKD